MSACDKKFRLLQRSERFDHIFRLNSPTTTRSSAARENPVFRDADYAWRGVFSRHVSLLSIVIGHRATTKKYGAVKDKLFPARRSTAQLAVLPLQ